MSDPGPNSTSTTDNVYHVWIKEDDDRMTRVKKIVECDGEMIVVAREWRLHDSANMWAKKNISCKYKVIRSF